MAKESSSHKVSLKPTTLARAKLVLGLLSGTVFLLLIFAVYNGIISGELDRIFLQPFRQFAADFNEAIAEPTPLPITPITPMPTTTQEVAPTAAVQQQYRAPVINCTRYNIREGEFASNKCYSDSDYDDLKYYLNRYNSAVFEYDGAVASMRITCSGSDFFKDSCERDKKRKSDSENDMNNYKGIIHAIIGRGR